MVSLELSVFVQGAIFFMQVGLSAQVSCNLDQHYPMQNNKGEITHCVPCRECGPGLQPSLLCGTTIHFDTIIGPCQRCPEGTSSSEKDTKGCKKCQSESCFPHQVIQGKCSRKNDTSKCTDECDTGYQMNANQTKCVMDKPDNSTTERYTKSNTPPSNNPTPIFPSSNVPNTSSNSTTERPTKKTLTMKKNTTKEIFMSNSSKNKETGLNVVIIIVILVVVALFIIFAFYKYLWPRLRVMKTNQDGVGEESSDAEQGSDVGEQEPIKLSTEEESRQPHLPGGFADTAPNDSDHASHDVNATPVVQNPVLSNIAGESNQGFMDSTPPPRNDSVNFEMPAQSPVQMPQPTGVVNQQPPLVQIHFLQQQPSMYVTTPNCFSMNVTNNVQQQDLTRVGALPSGLYDEICIRFDTGATGRNWRALAGWLGFTADQVNFFKEECKTDSIIRSWSTEADNDIQNFVSILNENKMTYLVDKIKQKTHGNPLRVICQQNVF